MRRINLPLILDTLFFAFCAFVLFFTSIRFYTKNAYVALGFGIAAGVLFGILSFLGISKKQNKKFLISKDEKQKKLLSLHLSLTADENIAKLLIKSLDLKAEISGNKIITDEKVYYFDFKMQSLSEDDVAKVIKHKTDAKKVIYCCKISPEAYYLADRFNIEVKDIDFVYNLFKEKQTLPEKYAYEEAKKLKLSERIKKRFKRRLCAPLFFSGLALLALSYFTFFPLYYVISGSLLMLLSAVTLAVSQE